MERKVGEIFTCDGKTYQVVKGITYVGCCILHDHCFSIRESLGPCANDNRTDKTGVIFKEIKDMEIKNNQLIIDIPEGMEIDLENSDLAKGIVRFKQSCITYETITLKPFDKVLVRDNKSSKWRANLFSHKNINEPYYCVYASWNYCIPYEGNEHLLGTTNNVEE